MIILKHLNLLFSAAAALCYSSSAYASIYSYNIVGNWTNQADCQKTAAEISDAFKSHVNVVSSNCEGKAPKFKLQVAYAAETNIEIVSTITKYIRQHVHQGGYLSQADCQASLSSELTLFKTNTGLEPFVAQCFNETGDPVSYHQYDWNIRIDAIGPVPSGAYIPSEIAVNISGYFLTPEANVRKSISDALVKKGLRPALVHAHHSSSIANLIKIRAYAQSELDLLQYDYAFYVDETSCLKEADQLNKSAYANEGIYLTAFCMSQTATKPVRGEKPVINASLYVVYLAEGLAYKDRPQKLPGGYDTYASCDAQRPSVIAKVEQSIGKPVRASFCGKMIMPGEDGNPQFFIQVIE